MKLGSGTLLCTILLLSGCCFDSNSTETQLAVRNLSERVRQVENDQYDLVKYMRGPKIADQSCVAFTHATDTHAILDRNAAVTIPVDGTYKVLYFGGHSNTGEMKAGQRLLGVQSLMRDTCPSYKGWKL